MTALASAFDADTTGMSLSRWWLQAAMPRALYTAASAWGAWARDARPDIVPGLVTILDPPVVGASMRNALQAARARRIFVVVLRDVSVAHPLVEASAVAAASSGSPKDEDEANEEVQGAIEWKPHQGAVEWKPEPSAAEEAAWAAALGLAPSAVPTGSPKNKDENLSPIGLASGVFEWKPDAFSAAGEAAAPDSHGEGSNSDSESESDDDDSAPASSAFVRLEARAAEQWLAFVRARSSADRPTKWAFAVRALQAASNLFVALSAHADMDGAAAVSAKWDRVVARVEAALAGGSESAAMRQVEVAFL